MAVGFARPDISDLVVRVFSRSVHPELIETFAEELLQYGRFRVRVCICDAGHVVSVESEDCCITEIATSRERAMPRNHCRLRQRLTGQRDESIRFPNGVDYHACYQVERLETRIFRNLHDELALDCSTARVSHQFPSGNRFTPSPLSLIQTDFTMDSLLVHAFHTFPENCAVVKTQSLFEFNGLA